MDDLIWGLSLAGLIFLSAAVYLLASAVKKLSDRVARLERTSIRVADATGFGDDDVVRIDR